MLGGWTGKYRYLCNTLRISTVEQKEANIEDVEKGSNNCHAGWVVTKIHTLYEVVCGVSKWLPKSRPLH